jgi:ribosomal protein S18 acetylase RimI-like enzyme
LSSTASTTYLLLAAGGEDVGFAKMNFARALPIGDGTGAELQKIYVQRSALGGGLGARLLAAVCDACAARGEPLVWLDVLKPNTRAQAFYRAHGFEEVGEIPYATDLVATGMIVMRRLLA